MKKPVLISLIAVGGAVLAAGVVYAVKKAKEQFGFDDCCVDCEGCADCEGCDNPCYVDGPDEGSEDVDAQEESEADGEDGP